MKIVSPKCAVILVGLPGSGKTTAANYLTELGFTSISAGDLIRTICDEAGVATTRENLSAYGQKLLRVRGYEYFADLLLSKANSFEKVVFEGVRPVKVLASLKERIQKTLTILVEASENKRLLRLMNARGEDEVSYRKVMQASMEHEIVNFENLVDKRIENNGDIEKFQSDLRRIVLPFGSNC